LKTSSSRVCVGRPFFRQRSATLAHVLLACSREGAVGSTGRPGGLGGQPHRRVGLNFGCGLLGPLSGLGEMPLFFNSCTHLPPTFSFFSPASCGDSQLPDDREPPLFVSHLNSSLFLLRAVWWRRGDYVGSSFRRRLLHRATLPTGPGVRPSCSSASPAFYAIFLPPEEPARPPHPIPRPA